MVKFKLSPNLGFMAGHGRLLVMLGFMELALPVPKRCMFLMVFSLSDIGLVIGINMSAWGFSLLDILFGVKDFRVTETGPTESCVSPKGNHYKVTPCRGWRSREVTVMYYRFFRYRGKPYLKVTSYIAMADRIMDRYCPGDTTKEHMEMVVDSLATPMVDKLLDDLLITATKNK